MRGPMVRKATMATSVRVPPACAQEVARQQAAFARTCYSRDVACRSGEKDGPVADLRVPAAAVLSCFSLTGACAVHLAIRDACPPRPAAQDVRQRSSLHLDMAVRIAFVAAAALALLAVQCAASTTRSCCTVGRSALRVAVLRACVTTSIAGALSARAACVSSRASARRSRGTPTGRPSTGSTMTSR